MQMQSLLAAEFVRLEVSPLELTVVVPTFNERENVGRLLELLSFALVGIEWEAIFVDDNSSDGTADYLAALSRTDRRVRLIRRFGRRGLSSAVVEGMLASTALVVAVIDADLQHDERILPDLYRAVSEQGAELAIGSRYAEGGSTGDWALHRRIISTFATRVAQRVARVAVSDPMSGFFAIDRAALVRIAPRLSAVGYKLLLDIVASAPEPLCIAERTYSFRCREQGESKLDSRIAIEYAELLAEKTIGRFVPIRFLKFAIVGCIGLAVHLAILSVMLVGAGESFRPAETVAVAAAITFNFFLNNAFTYRDRRLKGFRLLGGLLSFGALCSLGALANVGVGTALFREQHSWWLAGAAGAIVGSVWNYTMGNLLTWRR